jgi:hypothetical protein
MAGFNFVPPPGPLPPMQNLQQMALAAFRPPPPMSMGGGGMGAAPGMQAPQQAQGFGVAQGAGMLSGAMSGFKGWGGGPDGLPQSGLGNVTGTAANDAALMNPMPGNASYGDLGSTGFQPAYNFLGGAGSFGSNWGGGG